MARIPGQPIGLGLGLKQGLDALLHAFKTANVNTGIILLDQVPQLADMLGNAVLHVHAASVGGDLLAPPLDTPAARAERELEVRQMVSARSVRRVSRGEPALDVEAEVARLLGTPQPAATSAGLTEEVRQLVVARNERRVRQGLEPLDVDAEVARTLEELGA